MLTFRSTNGNRGTAVCSFNHGNRVFTKQNCCHRLPACFAPDQTKSDRRKIVAPAATILDNNSFLSMLGVESSLSIANGKLTTYNGSANARKSQTLAKLLVRDM